MRQTERGADGTIPAVPARPADPPSPREGDHMQGREAQVRDAQVRDVQGRDTQGREHRPAGPTDPAQERLVRPGEQPETTAARHAADGQVDGKVDGRSRAERKRDEHDQPEQLFTQQEVERLREHWHRVQGGFVDNPTASVEEADKLVVEAMKTLAEHKRSLESWRNGDAQTEELRQALRGYRAFLDRMLRV